MSWTTLIAEYLVVGCLATFWITLIACFAGGVAPGSLLDWMKGLPSHLGPSLVLLLLAIAYSLGTAVDHLCYLATLPYLKWYNRRNWERFYRQGRSAIGNLFYSAEDRLLGEEGQRDRLLRRRGRIRILRALFLQTPLIGFGLWLHYRSAWIIFSTFLLWSFTGLALYFVLEQFLRMIARAARQMAQEKAVDRPLRPRYFDL